MVSFSAVSYNLGGGTVNRKASHMKTATVISDSQGQTIRLPDGIRLEGDEVFVKRIGPSVVLIPKQHNPWQSLVESLDRFSDDYMQDREQPMEQQRPRVFE